MSEQRDNEKHFDVASQTCIQDTTAVSKYLHPGQRVLKDLFSVIKNSICMSTIVNRITHVCGNKTWKHCRSLTGQTESSLVGMFEKKQKTAWFIYLWARVAKLSARKYQICVHAQIQEHRHTQDCNSHITQKICLTCLSQHPLMLLLW